MLGALASLVWTLVKVIVIVALDRLRGPGWCSAGTPEQPRLERGSRRRAAVARLGPQAIIDSKSSMCSVTIRLVEK